MEVTWMVLFYFLIGVVFALVYILNYRPENPIWIGVSIVFWPVVILIDLMISLTKGLGTTAKHIQKRYEEKLK